MLVEQGVHPVLAAIYASRGVRSRDELERELDAGDKAAAAGEIGDLIFAMVNLARHCDADAEGALRGTNAKFERRFGFIEAELAALGRSPAGASLEEMDALWNEAKRRERT